jgi:aryl-alcohol dehydrogenase-like predicted oxidoreductase
MARHSDIHSSVLGRTGLHVSGAGFGGYRVSVGVEGHHNALGRALASGINLIDTSTNYADGGSEGLVGSVLAELARQGSLVREEVVIVTKAGYLQGSNYELARTRLEEGSGFPDVVEYGPGLWHCIAPEFLHDQLTRSLQRLQLPSVDVLLLHNPEYYLSWAHKKGVPLEEARREYYRRIRDAFAHLEKEVEEGRIGYYGISSNSFPHAADAADFTSLEEVIRIADGIQLNNHFAVIQFPANLVESGFAVEPNQSENRTLIEIARQRNLGVLINRPLNAITDGRVVRLADFPLSAVPVTAEEIRLKIAELQQEERDFLAESLESFSADAEGARALKEFLAVGTTMGRNWETFETMEHFNDVLSQHFAPRLGFVAQYLREHGTQEHLSWYTGYMNGVRALIHAVGAYYSADAQRRSDRLRNRISELLPAPATGSLSSLAIRLLLGVEGVDTVLVGMRREEYVDDVLAALRQGPLGDEQLWKSLAASL